MVVGSGLCNSKWDTNVRYSYTHDIQCKTHKPKKKRIRKADASVTRKNLLAGGFSTAETLALFVHGPLGGAGWADAHIVLGAGDTKASESGGWDESHFIG